MANEQIKVPSNEKKEETSPKKKWWQKVLDSKVVAAIGNAIGQAKFGGE